MKNNKFIVKKHEKNSEINKVPTLIFNTWRNTVKWQTSSGIGRQSCLTSRDTLEKKGQNSCPSTQVRDCGFCYFFPEIFDEFCPFEMRAVWWITWGGSANEFLWRSFTFSTLSSKVESAIRQLAARWNARGCEGFRFKFNYLFQFSTNSIFNEFIFQRIQFLKFHF